MDWFKHDINAHDDIKIRKLMRMHGCAAYGLYWYLVELLYGNGGAMDDQTVLDECMLAGFPEDDATDVMESFLSLGLFHKDGSGVWTNDRIIDGIQQSNTVRDRMKNLANRRWQNNAIRNATRMRTACDTQCEKRGEENRDYNLGRPSQEDNQSINKISKTENTEIVCAELLSEQELTASDPIFLTIITNTKEEYPIRESFVKVMEETYPAVDVKAQLRAMKAWSLSNPKKCKTKSGMKAFVNNWLKDEQNKAGRIKQNSETIRGTNIRMSLVADGTRPEIPERPVVFE